MTNLKENLLAFLRDEEGLTTVEYAIAGGLVAGGAIAAFGLLGDEVARVINGMKDALVAIIF